MATPTIASSFYAPTEPPNDPAELQRWIKSELLNIASVLQLVSAGHVDMTYVAPARPREGDIRLADGTRWKPNGSGGAGVWCYYGGSWKLLG